MRQIRLSIATDSDTAPRLAAAVGDAFEEEGWPVASFETDEARRRWSVSLYVPAEDARAAEKKLAALLTGAGISGTIANRIEREDLPDTDWVSKALAELKPVRAGRFIVHGGHDRAAPRAHERAILIEAGMAFGTGHHGTTAGCLEMLDHCLKSRPIRDALDVGTGSGVLAIAIAKSAPVHVLASDIDAEAVRIARCNCRINGVAGRVEVIRAAGLDHRRFGEAGPFDLVVANILAGPLQAMARDLARQVAPGGTIILSGLLAHQQARIVATYRQHGLQLVRAHLRDGWLTLVMRRS